ncbi:hypothetical protein SPI_00763 [Niveomyces insectorum RCEF 264]|uniref:Carbohydrate-binding module family 96 domain-containing protein n=1 Tax=Niveomyces insectorum RCEF 264 TaxID=1081102 RepID=A0A168ACN8_9HYPO|nr:hypothetical protein SPI_00763 [Niveomyces insectorum RCEF 264]
MKTSGTAVVAAFWAGLAMATTYPVIDPNLTPSTPRHPSISHVDVSRSKYGKPVLYVDGSPFFYNGIQLRSDNLRLVWNMTPEAIGQTYKVTADAGFTVANTQLYWMDVQPDSSFSASESTYIQGGASSSANFATSTNGKISYNSGNATAQSLAYLKFDFRSYSLKQIDAAKIRVYVPATADNSTALFANLYGISNNTWSAATLTWDNAPNHNGINVTGDGDYWLASSSPSWDPILSASYYDFDASDFIINHCPDKIASFILQPQVNETSLINGASVAGALSAKAPSLWLSSSASWDYSYVDTLLGWGDDAQLKLEFLWFGSDTSGATIDNRVPYFVYKHVLTQKVQADGTVVPMMVKNHGDPYGVYWYLADKNDFALRALEKTVLKNVMNHVAEYNRAHGNRKTLVGIDVSNEAFVDKMQSATGGGTIYENPVTWSARPKFASEAAFVQRTMWEFQVNLANAVKESNYPVWTRSNINSGQTVQITYNEEMRANGGTSVDFGGLDPYMKNATQLWQFGHEQVAIGGTNVNWATGANIPMIMENGGDYTNAEWLTLATVAGGGYYNVYDFMDQETFGMWVPADVAARNFTPVPAGPYVAGVVSTNKLLQSLSADLATKVPNGAGGTDLVFFNALDAGTNLTDRLWSLPVTYAPTTGGVGIGIVRSRVNLVLATTRDASFTLKDITPYGIASVQYSRADGSGRCKREEKRETAGGNSRCSGKYPYKISGRDIIIQLTQDTLVSIELRRPLFK